MPGFTESSLRLLKRLLGSRNRSVAHDSGDAAVLDGNTAVALAEAAISQAAGLGAFLPTDIAALTWRTEQRRRTSNKQESQLTGVSAEGPRGALASAAGMSLSGMRATAFISGQEMASLQDLLATIAGRHLPLVAHVDNRATGGSSSALGSGHEAVHLSAESGCFLLCAANVQEAVDFTLVARRVAEQTLLPGLVFMDREQTASAPQQVVFPSWQLLKSYLGQPEDLVPSVTPAEKLLFGSERRRIPRWHDPDRPVLLGGVQPTGIWGLGKVASRLYLEEKLAKAMTDALDLFASGSGRHYSPVTLHRVADADLLLVAMGSAVETAEAVADWMRSTRKLKVGVAGIRCLRPFPGELIAEQLGKVKTVCVMERLDSPATNDPPLLRELTAVIVRRTENRPRLLSVPYGLGGLPLRASDLFELCLHAESIQQRQVYLGIGFDQSADSHPKRRVLLDRLRRNYPDLSDRGLSGNHADEPDLAPEDAITLAIHRDSGTAGEGLALEAADFLWRVAGGELRSRMADSPVPWGDTCIDWVSWAPRGLRDPGDSLPVDLAVVTSGAIERVASDLKLNQQASLLIEYAQPDTIRLPLEIIERLRQSGGQIYRIHSGRLDAKSRNECLLGALFGIVLERELLDTGFRRLLSQRETALSDLTEDIREARLNAFRDGFEQLARVDIARVTAVSMNTALNADPVSPQLHRQGNIDDNYDSLPRFWDHTRVLYRDRQSNRITPDPYLAIGAVPPLSSAFSNFENLRETLPVLDAEACTGCGACWSLCPDGAVGVSALEPGMLLETGMRMTGMDGLRPLFSKLRKRMVSRCLERGAAPATAGELLHGAFDWMLQQSLPEARKQLVTEARGKIVEALGGLPIALTDALFREPESQFNGSGTILFLAINPATCKGCGLCVSHCEPEALTLSSQTPELAAEAKRNWQEWEQLPETTQSTIERAGARSLPGHPAAILMSQRFRGSLIGGDGAESGSGERLALRLVLAAAESRQQPLTADFIGEVNAVREGLSTLIRKMLADALPADDLDALSTGLDSVDTSETDLTKFINETEGAIDTRIDALRLRRLVGLAKKLRDLSWRLSEGRQGFGRASLGLVLSSNSAAGWPGVFPDNPFAVPVTVDTSGDAAQIAAGLMQGQLQQALEGFVLMRKARLELESPADAARLWSSLENLGWENLEAEERMLCPPVIIVGSSTLLAGRGLSQLSAVLAGKLPIKIIIFPELDLGLAAGAHAGYGLPLAPIEDPGTELALLTLSRRSSLNAQCSVGFPGHLMATLDSALNFPGPALIQVHAPSPGRQGFPADQTVRQARLAVETRAFPLFYYDPGAEGVFGSRFSLEGNPDPDHDWLKNDLGEPLTIASWALGERRFAQWFAPLPADTPDALPLEEYLALPEAARNGKRPFIRFSRPGRDTGCYQVKETLVRVCEERLRSWRTLQEIAGLVTPFTRRIEQQAQQAVAAAHQAELQKIQSTYEARISELKRELLEQSRSEIRARLMAMAGYDAATEESPNAPL